MKETAEVVTANFIWRFFERCGAQGVTFVVTIILARLLSPDDYGTIALMTVFISFFNVLISGGMGTALIQKKNADDLDFSSLFYFNITMCLLLYVIMYFAAPAIAAFYARPEMTEMIRVLSLTLVISGIKGIQSAYVARNMLFRRFFFATLSGTVGAAILGVWMAYKGYGVWALIAQSLLNNFVDTVILWITIQWRPKLLFSLDRLKELFSYGWKLLLSSVIANVYKDVSQLIIGKRYTSEALAFYNKGNHFPGLIVTNVNSSLDSVLFPTMSAAQDDTAVVKAMTRRAIKTSTYILAPLLMGLAFMSTSFVTLLLTEKWLPCVPFLCIFSVTYLFYPIHTANLNAIKAVGRSDLFLKLEIVKKAIGIAVLLATMWISPLAMALSTLLTTVTGMIVNSWPNKKLLHYSFLEQMKDIMPAILLAAFMGGCVWCIGLIPMPILLSVVIQIVAGAAVYIAGSIVLKIDSFRYIRKIAGNLIGKGKRKEAND